MQLLLILTTLLAIEPNNNVDLISIPIRDVYAGNTLFSLPVQIENRNKGTRLILDVTYDGDIIDIAGLSFKRTLLNADMVEMVKTPGGLHITAQLTEISQGEGVLFRLVGQVIQEGSTPVSMDGILISQHGDPVYREDEEDAKFRPGGVNVFPLLNQPIVFDDVLLGQFLTNIYDVDGDGLLSFAEGLAVDQLDISGLSLTSLAGMEWLFRLRQLDASQNHLTDVTPLLNLTSFGQPKSLLDVSSNWLGNNDLDDLCELRAREELAFFYANQLYLNQVTCAGP